MGANNSPYPSDDGSALMELISQYSILENSKKHVQTVEVTDFINSSLIPERYRNPADAAMILDMSKKMRIPATTIATNLVEYGGRQGWKATFVIQTINASGLFKGLLKFKYVGDKDTESYGCYAYATEAATDEVISGDVVDMFMVKQNKWDQAEDSPWKKSSMLI